MSKLLLGGAAILSAFILMKVFHAYGAQGYPDVDPWGNVYPEACKRADWAQVPANIVFDRDLGYWPDGRKTLGLFVEPKWPAKIGTIYVDVSVKVWQTRVEILRHEECHNWLWMTTGNPRWHPE